MCLANGYYSDMVNLALSSYILFQNRVICATGKKMHGVWLRVHPEQVTRREPRNTDNLNQYDTSCTKKCSQTRAVDASISVSGTRQRLQLRQTFRKTQVHHLRSSRCSGKPMQLHCCTFGRVCGKGRSLLRLFTPHLTCSKWQVTIVLWRSQLDIRVRLNWWLAVWLGSMEAGLKNLRNVWAYEVRKWNTRQSTRRLVPGERWSTAH